MPHNHDNGNLCIKFKYFINLFFAKCHFLVDGLLMQRKVNNYFEGLYSKKTLTKLLHSRRSSLFQHNLVPFQKLFSFHAFCDKVPHLKVNHFDL